MPSQAKEGAMKKLFGLGVAFLGAMFVVGGLAHFASLLWSWSDPGLRRTIARQAMAALVVGLAMTTAGVGMVAVE
jgi:hypothetical protein